MNRVGVLRCLAAAVLFGASTPAASLLAGDMPTLMLSGLLYLGAGLAVLPLVLHHRPSRAAMARSWRPLTGAVLFGGAIGPALLVAGLTRTSAATASLSLNLELVATVALATLFFREHLGGRLLAGASAILAAGVILVWQPGAELSVGALFVAGACLCWGLDNNLTAGIDQVAPAHITFLKGAVAGVASLLLGLLLSGSAGVGFAEVGGALVVGGFGYGLSITLWVQGARDLGAARAQIIFATAPFVGAVISWVLLSDAVTAAQLAGTALAAGGVWLALRSSHEHGHEHLPMRHDHEHRHDDGHHDHHHAGGFTGRHSHPHEHHQLVHAHSHVPDLHHRHDHES